MKFCNIVARSKLGSAATWLVFSCFSLSIVGMNITANAQQKEQFDKVKMLEAHNAVRSNISNGSPVLQGLAYEAAIKIPNQPIANPKLQPFTWNDQLALAALEHARKCHPVHDSARGKGIGENLYGSTERDRFIPAADIVGSWAEEAALFDHQKLQCKNNPFSCLHYTQIVWDTSLEIGCGTAICGDGTTIVDRAPYRGQGGQLTVCRYKASGNTMKSDRKTFARMPYQTDGKKPATTATGNPASPPATTVSNPSRELGEKVCYVSHESGAGGRWHDMVPVPASWTFSQCNTLKGQVGADTYRLACIFENAIELGEKNTGQSPIRDCGWENPNNQTSKPQKACNVVAPNNWRDTVAVTEDWTAQDCQTLMQSIGGTEFQLSCITDNGIIWGDATLANASPSFPAPDCGWEPTKKSVSKKACSAVTPGEWRDILIVPNHWTAAECEKVGKSMGAKHYQLACVNDREVSLSGGYGDSKPGKNDCGW